MPGLKIKTGDIYLVRFHPAVGSELHKYRPAVIVSAKISRIDHRFSLIAPFTTSTENYNEKYELLIKNNSALEKDSVLLCWYLLTIDSRRLITKLGCLSPKTISHFKKVIRQLMTQDE